MTAPTRTTDVAVLGSGVVGLACAHRFRQRGLEVLLIDAKGPGAETSFGNAGSISVGNVLPQSTPGIVLKGLRMLLDPLAPLKLDWRNLPSYWRWLLQFVWSGRTKGILPIIDALHAINHASRSAWIEWSHAIGAEDLLAHTGYLHVYEKEATFAAGAWERAQMQRHGVRFEVLERAALAELEPRLGEGFRHAVFQPDALAMRDPGDFCRRAAGHLHERGVDLHVASINAIQKTAQGYRLNSAESSVDCARLVLCGGAWAPQLLAPLNIRLPIVAARGYHLMFPTQQAVVHRPTLWAERYMVVSPMQSGIRMTSIKELTRLGSDPHFELIRRLQPQVRRLFPDLQSPAHSEWAGNRPCTPDSLPIIDRLTGEQIFLAVGHGHLGLTQAPVTGVLIDQLLAGETPLIDVTPYRLDRFNTSA
jgi:D-amino-acid dehydrogenase